MFARVVFEICDRSNTHTHACTLADRNSPHPNWQQSKMFSILVCVCFDNLFGTE